MKILVVDDSAMMRNILRKELEDAGYEVHEAVNGKEALDKAEEIKPHLVTMDVDMPEMDGYEAVYKIRTERKLLIPNTEKDLPVILVTANDTLEGRKKGFKVGAADFIIKPFLKGEVAAAVENLLYPDTTHEGMTILIVEDSNLTRSILVNTLSGEGIKTREAKNGVEALEILQNADESIDLVLTDFMMPEMDGDELCRRVRFELGRNDLPIIFLTAVSESGSMLKIFKSGASDYIVKPFAKEELLARVKVHLESRRLNSKLLDQVIELKRLNKLKDDILSITSHDLRSPLTGIIGFAELLMADKQISSQNQEFIGHIRDSSEFLLTLIADILELGRAHSESSILEYEPLSVIELIESSLNTVRHMATPKQIVIEIKNQLKAKPHVSGDKNALIRIINNLLSNAIKFTPKQGNVNVVVYTLDEKQLCIAVEDTGIGIPKKMIPHLFEKYSKASRTGTFGEKSTGLGLSITKTLIEQHGGNIKVKSKEGEGTSFIVTLPLLSTTKIEEPKDETEKVQSHFKGPVRILVVEDNATNAKLAKTVLSKRGHEVEYVMDGQKAVEAYLKSLEDGVPQYQIIFMDLRMPVMDGFAATARIRQIEKNLQLTKMPIVAMTATTDDAWKTKSQEMGFSGFISKPMNLQTIEETIARLIHIDKDQ